MSQGLGSAAHIEPTIPAAQTTTPKTVRGLQRAILTAVFFILVSLTWDTTSSRLAGHPTRSGFAVILGVMRLRSTKVR